MDREDLIAEVIRDVADRLGSGEATRPFRGGCPLSNDVVACPHQDAEANSLDPSAWGGVAMTVRSGLSKDFSPLADAVRDLVDVLGRCGMVIDPWCVVDERLRGGSS